MITLVKFQQNFVGKQNPLSAVKSVVMYEASVTQRSLLNQAAFCWLTRQICVTDSNPLQNLRGNCSPSSEISTCIDCYWNNWISLAKIHQTMVIVTATLVRLYLIWHKRGSDVLFPKSYQVLYLYFVAQWSTLKFTTH